MRFIITGDISTWNIKDFNINKFNTKILDLLKSSDGVIYNLEGPIGDKYTGKNVFSENSFINVIFKNLNNIFNKEQPQVFSGEEILQLLGINRNTIVTLANNHVKDLGLNGFTNTMDLLERNNINSLGGEKRGEDKSELSLSRDICLLNFNLVGKKYLFDLYGSNKMTFGASSSGFDLIYEKILEKKKQGKKVILILHMGKEMIEDIQKWDIAFEEVKKLNADVTVIHHPHVYIKTDFERDNIYILGDFLFHRPDKLDPSRETAFLDICEEEGIFSIKLRKMSVSEIYKY